MKRINKTKIMFFGIFIFLLVFGLITLVISQGSTISIDTSAFIGPPLPPDFLPPNSLGTPTCIPGIPTSSGSPTVICYVGCTFTNQWGEPLPNQPATSCEGNDDHEHHNQLCNPSHTPIHCDNARNEAVGICDSIQIIECNLISGCTDAISGEEDTCYCQDFAVCHGEEGGECDKHASYTAKVKLTKGCVST